LPAGTFCSVQEVVVIIPAQAGPMVAAEPLIASMRWIM
jgi:hypothetical protein